MAHGEAEHGCAQGEPCRLGHHDHQGSGRPHRRLAAPSEPAGRAPERPDDVVPRPRAGEPTAAECAASGSATPEPGRRARSAEGGEPGQEPAQPGRAGRGCHSDLAGWAGAHRHGPVRPRRRPVRRERPPQRWC
ncbi:hypothetical protein ACFY3U_04320 [Micromonospora sp. NPDC000089]|uniref:hypothetical protein n=1 Tax=unclassified Micromonospora TaxID=2617518 RepID=UPI0036B6A07F